MTTGQLRALAIASVLATAVVLGESARTPSSDAAVRIAQARAALTVKAAGGVPPAAAPDTTMPAPPPSLDDDVATPAADDAATEDAATDDEVVVEDDTAVADDAGATDAAGKPAQPAAEPTPKAKPSKVGHVFLITLSGGAATTTFADGSAMPYLAGELRPQGTLLPAFAPLDAAELPNQIALVSGQPPNEATRGECATYRDFPADAAAGDDGLLRADGCLYPNTVLTLTDQVTSSGRSWKAYVEGMDQAQAAGAAATCRRPDVGAIDDTLQPRPGDAYATRRNPFIYFHSLLDLGDCLANDVALPPLADDLQAIETTPNLAVIAPDACDAGGVPTCPDGRPAGPAAADAFLQTWVPRILESPAYRKDGLLVIALTAPARAADGSVPAGAPPATGALLISPFAKAGGELTTELDPYALLRAIEDVFALEPLGYAASAPSVAREALPTAFGKHDAG